MRSLQQEFIEISSNLKASLKQRMKFEIAERIISDSRSFMYFRLFMIQQYEHRYNSLKQFNPESPTLFKLTPLECANEYKTLIFSLINNLNIDHHTPGDKVISQNEDVLNEEEEFLEEVKIYFILTGNYKVESLMFEAQQRIKSEKEANKASREKNLSSGDFFGEVSLLFGCKRTSTVMAKQYCECAYLMNKDF